MPSRPGKPRKAYWRSAAAFGDGALTSNQVLAINCRLRLQVLVGRSRRVEVELLGAHLRGISSGRAQHSMQFDHYAVALANVAATLLAA